MNVSVTFRNFRSSTALREYAEQKLDKIRKYFDGAIEANVVLRKERHRKIAEIVMNSGRFSATCTEEGDEFREAIDKLLETLERQIKRQRQKVRAKNHLPNLNRLEMEAQADYEEASDFEARVVKSEQVFAKPMGLEEAIMQMDLSKKREFLVYTDASTQKINVLYRRKDGDFGLIETNVE